MCHTSLCVIAVLALVPVTRATAQVSLRPGARVRIARPMICPPHTNCTGGSPQQYVGTFVTWSDDTLLVQSNGSTIVLPLDAVTKLEVSQGQKSNTVVGALVGLLIGGIAGAAIAKATHEECEGGWGCFGDLGPRFVAGAGFVIGGLGGGGVGALIGRSIKTDRWEEVPLDRVRVSFGLQREGRFGFGASVRF
jgi:hypothetical protein